MKLYVLGFMFSPDEQQVALIRKRTPAWQAGKLNGIGGKVEATEGFVGAMVREFREETGAETSVSDWMQIGMLTGPDAGTQGQGDYVMSVFKSKGDLSTLRSTTAEQVEIVSVEDVPNEQVIHNLKWLVQLCLDDKVSNFDIKAA